MKNKARREQELTGSEVVITDVVKSCIGIKEPWVLHVNRSGKLFFVLPLLSPGEKPIKYYMPGSVKRGQNGKVLV